MTRQHTHEIFGQNHSHSVDFRHTSEADREAHKSEIETYNRLQRRKNGRKDPTNHAALQ